MTTEVERPSNQKTEAPRSRRRDQWWVPYAFLGPLLLVFTLFYLWPAFNTVLSSFFEWGLASPWRIHDPSTWQFVGLNNYVENLTSARFWDAVVNTSIWLVFFPVLVLILSLFISVAIWFLPRGGTLLRTAFILPMTISLAAAGVIWTFMYNPNFGVIPSFLGVFGLDGAALDWGPIHLRAGQWLSNPGVIDLGVIQIRLINLSLVVAGVWAFTGFGVITLTAGLTAISPELVEAARVDGARPLQIVRHVLVPGLRGSLVIVGTISFIFALRTFDIVWVVTQGGPATDSEVLAVLLYQQAFQFIGDAGLGTTVAVIMSVVLVLAAYPYLRGVIREEQR
jgi:ABC-type sugar transport system permease subunit